jgi:hypothetical protein
MPCVGRDRLQPRAALSHPLLIDIPNAYQSLAQGDSDRAGQALAGSARVRASCSASSLLMFKRIAEVCR